MRSSADLKKLKQFLEALSSQTTGPGTVYLVGGSSALAFNLRDRTIDIDLKLDPEPPGAFQAIARLKETLDVSVELASPDHFVPELPGWRGRSIYISQIRQLTVKHFDLYSQVLAKAERLHTTDIADVNAYVERGLVFPEELYSLFLAVRDQFVRYPAVDVDALAGRLIRLKEKGRL